MSNKKKPMYYIQDIRNLTGNCPVWMTVDKNGYTSDIEKAALFTYEEAMKIYKENNMDLPWKKEDVEAATRKIVDIQYLKKNDKDGFYTTLERISKDNRISLAEEYQNNLFNSYVKTELFMIREYLNFNVIKNLKDFEHEFDKAKSKMDWYEHYYPIAFNKRIDEIYNDLKKYDLIFCCESCKQLLWSSERNIEYTTQCNSCTVKETKA